MQSSMHPTFTLSAENQTKFILRKIPNGEFNTEKYSYVPSESYLQGKENKFSGLINIKNLNDSTKDRILLYKNGQFKKMTSKNESNNTTQRGATCYYLNYYLCDVDDNGMRYNCELLSTTPLGCYIENVRTDWLDPMDNPDGAYLPENQYNSLPLGEVTAEKDRVEICGSTETTRTKCYYWKTYTVSGNHLFRRTL